MNLTRPRHSADHAGQENIWFVRCLTATRATPASRESHSKTGVNGPNGLRELTMQTFHGVGHPAAKETARRISKFYYWPRLKKDVAEYTASCHPCQATKPGNIKPHTDKFPIPDRRFQDLHLDMGGSLPESQGNG